MISESNLSIFRCPTCKNDLSQEGAHLICVNGNHRFPIGNSIVVFLTKDDLAGFFGEAWGAELQKERDGYFASTEEPPEDLRSICEEARTTVNRSHWPITAPGVLEEVRREVERSCWPFCDDSGISKEAAGAIAQSREELARLSRATSAKKVLDWPTGGGYCLTYLINQVAAGTLVVGLDVNFGSLAKTKVYFDECGLSDNMLFVVADARNMPFKDNVFQSVTAWGGTVEIENADAGFEETFRVLENNGWFGASGEQYKENSPSMRIAEQIGVSSLVTKNKLEAAMKRIGFRNPQHEVLFEGYDIDDNLSDEERCPLPARGDWYQYIVASGQK